MLLLLALLNLCAALYRRLAVTSVKGTGVRPHTIWLTTSSEGVSFIAFPTRS